MKNRLFFYIAAAFLFLNHFNSSCLADQDVYDPETLRIDIQSLQPNRELVSPIYRIHEDVINRGFINYYEIDSPFGTFEAIGDYGLENRLNEIRAIDTLQKMSKSEVFLKTVGDTVTGQAQSLSRAVTNPKETITGIPDGLNRLWKRSKRQVTDTYENVRGIAGQVTESSGEGGGGLDTDKTVEAAKEEGSKYLKKSTGITAAHRKLAGELQVDPYTDNQVLQEELTSMARVIAASGYGLNQVMPSIPKEIGMVSDVQKMVWDMDPLDLRLQNEKILAELGINEAVIKKFLDHKSYSPGQKTQIVQTLKELGTTIDTSAMINIFMDAGNKTESRFYSRLALFIQLYNKNRDGIQEVVVSGALPIATTKNGSILIALPVDYLTWTEISAEATERIEADIRQLKNKNSTGQEIWVEGTVSPKAKKALSGLHWKIYEKMFAFVLE